MDIRVPVVTIVLDIVPNTRDPCPLKYVRNIDCSSYNFLVSVRLRGLSYKSIRLLSGYSPKTLNPLNPIVVCI